MCDIHSLDASNILARQAHSCAGLSDTKLTASSGCLIPACQHVCLASTSAMHAQFLQHQCTLLNSILQTRCLAARWSMPAVDMMHHMVHDQFEFCLESQRGSAVSSLDKRQFRRSVNLGDQSMLVVHSILLTTLHEQLCHLTCCTTCALSI